MRLEIRAEDGKDGPLFGRGGSVSDSGISLTSLIEIFSQPARSSSRTGDPTKWAVHAGRAEAEHSTRIVEW